MRLYPALFQNVNENKYPTPPVSLHLPEVLPVELTNALQVDFCNVLVDFLTSPPMENILF